MVNFGWCRTIFGQFRVLLDVSRPSWDSVFLDFHNFNSKFQLASRCPLRWWKKSQNSITTLQRTLKTLVAKIGAFAWAPLKLELSCGFGSNVLKRELQSITKRPRTKNNANRNQVTFTHTKKWRPNFFGTSKNKFWTDVYPSNILTQAIFHEMCA